MTGEQVEKNTSEVQVDLDSIKPMEAQSVDLMKYDKTGTTIERASVIKVPSKFNDCGTQWVLKVESPTLETMERTADDGTQDVITFKSSEFFNLIQNEKGELLGFPTGQKSNLHRFLIDLGIKEPDKFESLKQVIDAIIGKKVLIKAYERDYQGTPRTYLKFRY